MEKRTITFDGWRNPAAILALVVVAFLVLSISNVDSRKVHTEFCNGFVIKTKQANLEGCNGTYVSPQKKKYCVVKPGSNLKLTFSYFSVALFSSYKNGKVAMYAQPDDSKKRTPISVDSSPCKYIKKCKKPYGNVTVNVPKFTVPDVGTDLSRITFNLTSEENKVYLCFRFFVRMKK